MSHVGATVRNVGLDIAVCQQSLAVAQTLAAQIYASNQRDSCLFIVGISTRPFLKNGPTYCATCKYWSIYEIPALM